ncbi:MAPEG family protein [Vibrio rumoiensis]|uniref:MAPEG family protein n=1 Tax=Vibrio rumoiensis 1S-45 TaxID=1188252 RepID=A0A1E5E2J9_9VIBR|nr:MAPEG family protein [Vibrio rumoiensis]OEF25755.1 hypothetical protein A1QC_08285 [Vibrio rumoiensis 1S-45]
MIYAMAAMILLVFLVACFTFKVRVASIKSKQVNLRYFQLMQGENLPEIVMKTNRHLTNLFEVPVLFYVVATLYVSLHIDSQIGITLAWLFVALRYLHTFIHLSSNHLMYRMLSFWASFLCVIGLWINLLIQMP